jgi:hypothetical protein
MHVRPRSYLTAGIAALGAGAIALTPIQPLPNHITAAPQHAVQSLAVDLAATVNPIAAWVDTIKATTANSATLLKFYLAEPFPLTRTLVANQVTYLKELLSGNASLIFPQIKANIQTVFKAPMDPGETATLSQIFVPDSPEITIPLGTYLSNTTPTCGQLCVDPNDRPEPPFDLNLGALQFTGGLSVLDDPESIALWGAIDKFQSVWRFLNNHLSGLLVAAAGPVLSPLVSLGNSFSAFSANLKAGKILDAVYEIINIPAKMTNALLNGAGFTDLTKIVSKFAPVPEGAKVGINMGGLLNAVPQNGSLIDPENPPTEYSGGTAFDALAVSLGPAVGTKFPGLPVGLGGSMIGMGQFLAGKLRVTPPAARTAAAVKPVAAVEAATVAVDDAPAPVVTHKSARASAATADQSGGTKRAGGHARSARSSR